MTQQKVRFTKMHGAGNDYIYVNTLLYNIPDPSAISLKWSAYHTGIGSDGLVLIGKPVSAEADFSMRIFNADGSEAMMCGNASRCIGKYLYERKLTDKTVIRLETLSGIKVINLHIVNGKVNSVTVDMLAPGFEDASQFAPEKCDGKVGTVQAADRTFSGTYVSMGNPHFVIFVDDVEHLDIAKYGSILECHEAFPSRCNIEFAEMRENGDIRMRVWERGSGITLACGTGACATAVAAAMTGRSGRESSIVMDGGRLSIKWLDTDGHVYMTGGATFVFDGEIEI
ncbi:MAG: diaminopimelate epimerase [Prevotella sp.]|nr:diaminopimelate epimerase [Prevotella sp.]